MDVRPGIPFLLALVLLSGCQLGQRRNTAALEQELRQQEDRIYQLQDTLDQTQYDLEESRRENESLRRSMADAQNDESTDRPASSRPHESPKSDADIPDMPDDLKIETSPGNQFQDQVPDILRGSGAPPRGPSGESERLAVPPAAPIPQQSAPGQPNPLPTEAPTWQKQNDAPQDNRVTWLELTELAPEPKDARPGTAAQQGIQLVLVPRNELGHVIASPAPISIVVADAALSGDAASIARWDFSAEEAATLLGRSASGEGFLLRLRWPQGAPIHKQLHLYARYVASDGRTVDANLPFDLDRMTLADRREAARPSRETAGWQRKLENEPAADIDPPRWNGASPEGSDRSETVSNDVRSQRKPLRVADRPRPVWSPDRK